MTGSTRQVISELFRHENHFISHLGNTLTYEAEHRAAQRVPPARIDHAEKIASVKSHDEGEWAGKHDDSTLPRMRVNQVALVQLQMVPHLAPRTTVVNGRLLAAKANDVNGDTGATQRFSLLGNIWRASRISGRCPGDRDNKDSHPALFSDTCMKEQAAAASLHLIDFFVSTDRR
jgi:hypothetical protein